MAAMRRSIDELRLFYGEPAGALARRLLARRLEEAWGEAVNCDVLGLGYATPWLDAFVGARRIVAAMPAAQGVEQWPPAGRNRTVLVDDRRLPFPAGAFDRVLMIHALEEAEDAQALMLEAVRALTPAGRLIVVTAARGGLWAHAESTPFGHGRPFTRAQLEQLVRGAGLEPTARSQALYVPPWRPLLPLAEGFEQVGRRLAPATAGVILLEATRQAYARIKPGGAVAPAVIPRLRPQPVARARRDLASGREPS